MKTLGLFVGFMIVSTMACVGFRLLGNTITDTPLTQNLDASIISGVILGLFIPICGYGNKRREAKSNTSIDD